MMFGTVAESRMLTGLRVFQVAACVITSNCGTDLSCYNLRMSKTVTTIDQHASVALPPEALDALGVAAGAELEVEIVGRALVVRSVEEARRSREFMSAFESILSKRRTAYEELAKGPNR
jgi:antitoxin component of MazEF toxin-antitoxin module